MKSDDIPISSMTMSTSGIKIVFIAGATRSGSTLLSRLLGELDGFTNIGEASRWLLNTQRMDRSTPCGCGLKVSDCPFWGSIVQNIEGSQVQQDGTELIRIRHLPRLMSPFKTDSLSRKWDRILSASADIVHAIAERSGSRVIVDSSKNPANAFVFSQIPGIQLYTVHLIRDPRGVVSSWARPKAYLRAFPLPTIVGWWLSYNLSAEVLSSYSDGYLRIRYEDFLREPQTTLRQVLACAQEPEQDLKFMDGNRATIGVQHLLASNPDKLSSGQVTIEPRGWMLSRPRRVLVTALTFPLLLRYHYPVRA